MIGSRRTALMAGISALALMTVAPTGGQAADGGVVATIKPIHSLVAGVMEGVDTPILLVDGAASPHDYALRPSDARNLENADVVFWVGPGLEAFLVDALPEIANQATIVELATTDGLTLREAREGGVWDAHDHDHGHGHDDHGHEEHADAEDGHDDHGHDDHASHDHASHDHDDHGHEEHAEAEHGHDEHGHDDHGHEEHAEAGHDEHAGHAHGASEFDVHIWMDPENAKVMVGTIVETLSAADPDNADRYADNGARMTQDLDALKSELDNMFASVRDEPFIVFHDAYHYLEARFDLNGAGSITVNPEVPPGAARVRELRDTIADRGAVCVFSEPQFQPRIVTTIIEGTDASTAELDPLGAAIENGPNLYGDMMRANAEAIVECLGGTS